MRWLTVNEAVEVMGISRETIRKLINSGALPASKIAEGLRRSPIRISDEDIAAYMKSRLIVPEQSKSA